MTWKNTVLVPVLGSWMHGFYVLALMPLPPRFEFLLLREDDKKGGRFWSASEV